MAKEPENHADSTASSQQLAPSCSEPDHGDDLHHHDEATTTKTRTNKNHELMIDETKENREETLANEDQEGESSPASDKSMSEQDEDQEPIINSTILEQNEQSSSPSADASSCSDESQALNEAFVALESMRIANLQLELHNSNINPRHCVTCLRKEFSNKKSSWGWRKRHAVPCLVCTSPTCAKHAASLQECLKISTSDSDIVKNKQLTICQHCAPLFGLDFILDLINHNHDDNYRRAAMAQVVDSYDRALILLRYSSQFIDNTAAALQQSAARDNKIGLGSSSVGLVSGLTGVAAAAIHFAAVAAVGTAAVLTPVGPPLLVASIVFGGTAAAASSGSEAVSYYSEPNQLASRILALHQLVNSLLSVTVTLKDALTRGHINLDLYLGDNNNNDDDTISAHADLLIKDSEQDDAGDDNVEEDQQTTDALSTLKMDESSKEEEKQEGEEQTTSNNDVNVFEDLDEDDDIVEIVNEDGNKNSLITKSIDREQDNDSSSHASGDDSKSNSSSSSSSRPSTTKEQSEEKKQQLMARKKSSDNIRQAVTRTATNAVKAAQVASAACGVLSVASIILEAKNMTDALERMKAGNRHPKAEILLAIKEEVEKLPDTSLIAEQCESYLRVSAVTDNSSSSHTTTSQGETSETLS